MFNLFKCDFTLRISFTLDQWALVLHYVEN